MSDQKRPVAIVGIGLRFPGGANDPRALWQILRDGVDAITEIPPDRWSIRKFFDSAPGTPGKTNACWGGFIQGIDRFDAAFFGISPREAARMDPQQRLLLEVAWEALEDAGLPAEQLEGTNTGVFIGLSSTDYMLIQQSSGDLELIDAHTNTGGAMSIAANRISYCLNLRGPSIALDTACSSSLVAVHEACQSIQDGECPVALAGGVNVLIKPEPYIGFSRLSMLSADGRCKAFDASANGFVRSEGAAVIVLKPLDRALADGDRIYSVILSSACNQDGRTTGLTVPSEKAQEELVRRACQEAGIDPSRVQFVEAHGPGTLVGDPIEARALGAVLGQDDREEPCVLGSIKTNIGHLEPAAGIAGLIKVALALSNGEIPRNLHYREPNPTIPFDKLKLRVPTTNMPWSDKYGPPLAGVNSFGFGGTNAHVVMQQYDPQVHGSARAKGNAPHIDRPQLVPLSARSSAALTSAAADLARHLGPEGAGSTASFDDVVYTASLRHSHHDHRLAIVAADRDELIDKLTGFAAGESRPGLVHGRSVSTQPARLAFVCSGQGPQWWAMGRELIATEPVFRRAIEECDAIVRTLGPWSLWNELMAAEADSRMQETAISQPAIFAIQVALARLWESWGIRPDALVGHSVGEVAAAHLAGAMSLEDAVRTIYHRGRCMDFAEAHGRMLAVGLPMEQAQELVVGREDRISLAANNSPGSVTLSGDGSTLEAVAAELEQRGVFNKFLRVQYAFHSPQMEPMQGELLEALKDLAPRTTRLPLYSTVTGERAEGPELVAEYWWRNVRRYVRFAQATERMMDDGYTVFLELSPHPVLSSSVAEIALARRAKVTALPSLRRGEPERVQMLQSLGTLFALGVPLDWAALAPENGRFTSLPRYPWQREPYWSEAEESRRFRLSDEAHPLLGERLQAARPTWETKVDARVLRYLADHRVQGQMLLSGTSFLEMALAAAREVYGPGAYAVEEVELERACFLPEDHSVTLQLVLDPDESSFAIYSRPREEGQPWTWHARGKVRPYGGNGTNGSIDLAAIRARCAESLTGDQTYEKLGQLGLDYGPTFRGIERLWSGEGEALGRITIPEPLRNGLDGYQAHPAILDACFQVLAGALVHGSNGSQGGVYLPVEYEKIRVRGRTAGPLWSHARLVDRNGKGLIAEVDVLDEDGTPLLEVRGLRCQSVEGTGDVAATRDARELVYEYRWQLAPRPDQVSAGHTAEHLPGPEEITARTAQEAQRLAEDLGLTEKYRSLEREVNALCTAFLLHAFGKLGAKLTAGERFETEELAKRMRIDGRYGRLLHRYLEMLAADRVVERDGTGWRVIEAATPTDPKQSWQDVMARNPAFYAELTLLGRCGQQLAEILRGEVDPLHLIFPDGSLSIAEHLYQDSPSLRFYNTLVQRAVKKTLETLPRDRMLNVLEVGAGTGGMSSYVLPVMPRDRTRYVYTDLSNHFFQKAQEKFADFPFVEYKRLDIESDPFEQGFEPHSFDLILASECLHATTDMRATMRNVNRLLASDGLLVLLEAVTPVRWVDLVFGLTDGWWRFTDTDLRPTYPLLTFEKWQSLLAEQGYVEVREASGRPAREIENAVIVARGPHLAEQPAPVVETEAVAEGSQAVPGTWLVYGDASDRSDALVRELEAQGDRVIRVRAGSGFRDVGEGRYEIDPESRDDARQLVEAMVAQPAPWKGIVHTWMLDAPATSDATLEGLDRTMGAGCLSVVHLAHVLSEAAIADAPRLWLVTAGAQSVGHRPEPTAAPQAALWGLGRVVMNEVPKLRATLVDLDPAADDASFTALAAELRFADAVDEVALRGRARYVHRYVRSADFEDAQEGRTVVPSGSEAYRLETSRQGTLDKLALRACRRPRVEPGQVEVQVQASGLNFADVMKALGLYPGLPDGPVPLGIECAGRITAVGEGVTRFKPGDEVVAIAPFAFGAFIVTSEAFVAPKPPQLSFEEAATIPIAFLTTHYAMNHLGRMRRGERVLIHSATGGVGLAAIQLARRAGAEVLATAGSPEKRDFLRSLGIEHVFDSRSLEFADGVMAATGGRGVDIVLNSLAGEAIRKGLGVLGDYGRFLEIGKRDIYADSRLGMRPFKKNLSFMAIDLDRAMRERPEELAELYQELMADVAKGELKPLPYRVFPVSNVTGAFRYMTKAKHIGKVVVSMHEPEVAIARASFEGVRFREEATYLMTGGLGGFGLVVAQWMVAHGARNLVLMGRSGASTPEAQRALEELRSTGANVVVAQADATDPAQVSRVLSDIDRDLPPLRGVMHAAMVLRDRLLADLDRERMNEVWAPKVLGAWNLHRLTADRELDFFVLFSSLSSVFGIGGQANYASGNSFLDSLSYWRQSQGLPSVTVSWGYLGQVGWVARHDDIAERLEHQGVRSFTPQQALALLGRFLQEEPAHVGVMHIDWKRWGESAGSSMVAPRFAELVRAGSDGAEQGAGQGGAALRRALLEAPPEQRHELMVGILRDQVARVLGHSAAQLDLAKPLTELGLDSLMAVELRNWIEGDLRLSLPTVELMKGPSVIQLADVMLAQLAKLDLGGAPARPAPAPARAPRAETPSGDESAPAAEAEELLARVDEMPDAQVEALLREMAPHGVEGGAANGKPRVKARGPRTAPGLEEAAG